MALAIALGTTAWRRPADAPEPPAELNGDTLPAVIEVQQGGTFNLASYISGGTPPYEFDIDGAGDPLPEGVTLDPETGVLSADAEAETNTGSEPDVQFGVTDSAPTGDLNVQIGLTSAVGGSNLPFALGHVFAEGDVPAGSYVDAAELTDWQAVPTTYWPDGSLRHAIIAGLATLTEDTRRDITLTASASNRAGTALTESDLTAALAEQSFVVHADSEEISLADLVGTGALHRTVCAGPVMSNWIYRYQLDGSDTEWLWLSVRLFKGGNVRILPWVENCTFMVSGLTNHVRQWTVEINGAPVFDAEIDIKARTRVFLLDGDFEYWLGIDPQIVPKHDSRYLRDTRMVPNYMDLTISSGALNALIQGYEPNTTVGMTSMNTSGGDSSALLGHSRSNADPYYVITTDPRAWRAMLTHAMSGGSWHVHYRDETTGEPISYADWPTASINVGGTPSIPAASGGTNQPLGQTSSWTSHQPSYAYLAWLCTGDQWFLDEMLFFATNNYLNETPGNRGNANSVHRSDAGANTDRGAAWAVRAVAQTLACLPSDHPLFNDIQHAWESNVGWYHGHAVSGSLASGAYQNSLGIVPMYLGGNPLFSSVYDYSGDNCDLAGWMQMMIVASFGFAHGLKLPQSTTQSHQELCEHLFKLPVGNAGSGDPNEWDFRWFGPYELAYGLKNTRWFTDWREAYEAVVTQRGITPTGSSLQRSGTNTTWSDEVYLGSYFGQHHVALALAVDFGFPGAAEAWDRVTSATNYASYTAGFTGAAYHAIVPRSP